MQPYDVKITVVKKTSMKDVFGSPPPAVSTQEGEVCPALNEGDVFISKKGICPEGFCAWAFADIQRDIAHIRFGGSYPWVHEEGVAYPCCTDGMKPVTFRLERVR